MATGTTLFLRPAHDFRYSWTGPNLGTHNLALISTAARGAVGSIPELKAWRSVAFSGTSFPESLAALPYGLSTIVREEWHIWQKLQTIADNTRPIIFADYTAGNANLPEGGFVGAANIRYATDDEWIILKGHKATDDTHGGYEQFHDLAMLLIKDQRFCGPDFSWGDKYIADCAHRTVKSGNLSTWRAVATNHHITFVLAQLAKQATAGA